MQRCTLGRVCAFVRWSVCVCLEKWALLIWDHRWHGSHSLLCASAVGGSPAWLPELAWCSCSLNARLNSCFSVCVCVCAVGMVLQAHSVGRQRPGAMVTWCQTTSWWEGWCALARKCVHVHACIHTQSEKMSMLAHTDTSCSQWTDANTFSEATSQWVAWTTRQLICL